MNTFVSKIRIWHVGFVMALVGLGLTGFVLLGKPDWSPATTFAGAVIAFFLMLFGTGFVMGKQKEV